MPYILVAVSGFVLLLGLCGNFFIIFSNVRSTIENKRLKLANVLVTGIAACSFVIGLCAFLWQVFLFVLHLCPFVSYQSNLLLTIWMMTYNIEFWLIVSLCIFYCLTVVSFKVKILVEAKKNVSSVVCFCILFGLLITIFQVFLVTNMHFVVRNDTLIPITSDFSCSSVTLAKVKNFVLSLTIILQFFITTSLTLSSCGALIYYLHGHVRHLERSSFGVSSTSQENLMRITKMITALASAFIISTISSTIPIMIEQYTDISMMFLTLVFNLLSLMVPTALITGIIHLRQKAAATMAWIYKLLNGRTERPDGQAGMD
ncbi:TR114 protein, partial [Polypterus senegalus]